MFAVFFSSRKDKNITGDLVGSIRNIKNSYNDIHISFEMPGSVHLPLGHGIPESQLDVMGVITGVIMGKDADSISGAPLC